MHLGLEHTRKSQKTLSGCSEDSNSAVNFLELMVDKAKPPGQAYNAILTRKVAWVSGVILFVITYSFILMDSVSNVK